MPTTIKITKKKKFKNPAMIIGLPGIGLVGKIAADYILKNRKGEKVGMIYSDSFPPSVQTTGGMLELICDEIVHVRASRDLLFVVGPVQPSLDMRASSGKDHYEFADAIIKAAKDLGVREIFTLAGINIGDKRIVGKPNIVIAGTSKGLIARLKKTGKVKTEENGFISGAAGLVLGLAKEQGIDGACIMGETNARLIYGDHGAAKAVVEYIAKMFGMTIEMGRIEKESKKIEEAFNQLTKELADKTKKSIPEKESSPTYVR